MAEGGGRGPKVGIVTLNFNAYDDTKRCLDSLLKQAHNPKEIIVVDNGSIDRSPGRLLQEYPQVALLRSEANLGYGGGVNLGFRKALEDGCPYVVCFNNDGVVDDPQFLGRLLSRFEKDPGTGVAGAVELDISGENVIHTGAGSTGRFDMRATGAAFMISRKALDAAGMFDPGFFLGYEDVDLFNRVEAAGLRVITDSDAKFRHSRLSARRKYPLLSTYLEARNRTILITRQGSVSRFLKHVLWFHAKRMPRYALVFGERGMPEMFFAYLRGLFRGIALVPRSRRPGKLPTFNPSRWMKAGERPLDL